MVGALATANHLVLGQVKVNDKSNEITAIPEDARARGFAGIGHGSHRQVDGGHGRVEIRCCFTVGEIDGLRERHPAWLKLGSMAVLEALRQVDGKRSRVCVAYGCRHEPHLSLPDKVA